MRAILIAFLLLALTGCSGQSTREGHSVILTCKPRFEPLEYGGYIPPPDEQQVAGWFLVLQNGQDVYRILGAERFRKQLDPSQEYTFSVHPGTKTADGSFTMPYVLRILQGDEIVFPTEWESQ